MGRILWTPLGVRLPQPYCKQYPHPPQEAFLWLKEYDAFYGGAAGPGKSSALLTAALQYVDVPHYAALLIRKRMVDLEQEGALIPRSKEWLMGTDAAWNDNDHKWSFPSGASLTFGYLEKKDDHLRYQGAEYQFIGVDEASQIRPNQLRYLFSRLRQPDYEETGDPRGLVPLRMRLASNPGDIGHEYLKARYIDKLIDPGDPEDTEEKAQSRVFIRARLSDNPSVNQATYLQGLSNLEPEVRAQLLDGDWDARMPGNWYFTDEQFRAIVEKGHELEAAMGTDDLPWPAEGVLHLGIDWGESTHALLGWPLEGGGVFIAREFVGSGSEPGVSAAAMLRMREDVPGPEEPHPRAREIVAALSEGLTPHEVAVSLRVPLQVVDEVAEWDPWWPWGRARYDAAGVQSQRTFDREAEKLLGPKAPRKSKIPFGARASTSGRTAARSYKGLGCLYLRRLARRTAEGEAVQIMGVSPKCPVFLRQLKMLERDPEDPSGAWLKDDDQHGPDAGVALVAPMAKRNRQEAAKLPLSLGAVDG